MDSGRREFLRLAVACSGLAFFGGLSGHARAECACRKKQGTYLLNDFPLHKQETPYTCGPASARMVLEFLGHPVPEYDIAKRMGTMKSLGTMPGQLLGGLNHYLAEFDTGLEAVTLRGGDASESAVAQYLEKGLPVIASFYTENFFKPGTRVGHYAVIIGVDFAKGEFTLANPFGYKEQVDIERFWRLAQWAPEPGDIPNVKKQTRPLPFKLPKALVVLSGKSPG